MAEDGVLWLEAVGVVLDDGLVSEDDELRGLGICGQEPPVDEATIAEIRVVRFLGRQIEHALDHVLRLLRVLEEALDGGREELKLDRRVLLLKGLEEGVKELVGVVDTFGVLTNDPDHGRLGLGLVESVKVVAQGGDDALIPVGVTAENVLDDDDGLLHDVVDFGLDELKENPDAALGRSLELDGASSDGADGLADEVDVDLCGVLLELEEDLVDVPLRNELNDNLKLLHLDVDWIVVLAEEDLDLVLEDGRALLHDEIDVAEGNVLDLWLRVKERDERGGQLAGQVPYSVGVRPVHGFHVGEDDLHGAHDDGRVGVL